MSYETIKVKPGDVRDVLGASFAAYRGNRVRVTISGRGEPQLLHSYWDGGSRSTWAVVNMTMHTPYRAVQPFQWGGNFDRRVPMNQLDSMRYAQQLGEILVEHVEGPREAIYLHVREDDAALVARFKTLAPSDPTIETIRRNEVRS